MPLFGKRSRSKGAPEEKKSPPAQQQQEQQQSQQKQKQQSGSGNNAARSDQRRGVTKNGAPVQAPNGTPLSPAERTAQRAALMAASRKRMNSDNPDYSITGSFSSSTKEHVPSSPPVSSEGKAGQPSKTAHKTLVKDPKPPDDGKKKKKGSAVESSAQIAATAASKSPVPDGGKQGGEKNASTAAVLGNVFQRTSPLPHDSPTLGFTPEKASPKEQGPTRSSQPSADSGYGSVTESASDMREARNASSARVDNGPVVRKPSPARRNEQEKMLINPPVPKTRSRAGSKSGGSGYVSRLDPGPSDSNFFQPVNFSRPSMEFTKATTPPRSAGSMDNKARHDRSPLQPIQIDNNGDERKRSVYNTAPSSPTAHAKPQPQYAQPARSSSSSSRGNENPVPYISETISTSSTSQKVQPVAPATQTQPKPAATTTPMPTSKFNTLTTQASRAVDSRPNSHSSTKSGAARFADGATLLALQANIPDVSKSSLPAASAPTSVPTSLPTSQISTPIPHSTITQTSNHHPTGSNGSDGSTRRSTIPPVSALEGYKVNKRGQVLDEEGDAIGELFEGDLIDCVRQKVNAEGEVVDEFGIIVGRVRPMRRGALAVLRYSEDSTRSGFQPPRAMGSAMSSDRRESNVSQSALSQPSRGRTTSRVSSALTSQTVVSPVDTQGNTIIAELDASTTVEAFPVIDHSEIFIPTFGSSTRNQSPSQLIKAELPAEERRPSVASMASRDASPSEQRPKKWASRYFDPGPDEGGSPLASRRNSQSPAAKPSLRSQSLPVSRRTSQSQASPTPVLRGDIVSSPVAASPVVSNGTPIASSQQRSSTVQSNWNSPGAFKAVLGPTLEDLAEEAPSRPLSQSSKAGRSTPNLHGETPRGSVTSPRGNSPVGSRRASLQNGLGPRTSYQPVRRSPLSNFEATPSTDVNGLATRSVSQRASASVPAAVAASRDSEDAEAAPAPEIPKARARPGKKVPPSALEKTKSTVDRRKSRFSMFLGKKEPVSVQ